MSRLRAPLPPALYPPNSPNQARLRYAELYNNETLGVRAPYPRPSKTPKYSEPARPPLPTKIPKYTEPVRSPLPRSIPESTEPANPQVSSYQHKDDGIRISSSNVKEEEEGGDYDAKDPNLSEEVVTVTDDTSIHSIESLTPFKPNLNKSDEAYFSLDSVALTERSESDGTQFSSMRSIDLRLQHKSPPPVVAPRPTRTTSKSKRTVHPPPVNNESSEYIELQSLKTQETISDLESVSSRDDVFKSDKEDTGISDTNFTDQITDLDLPVKSSSAENLDRDSPKQKSPLLIHSEPLPGHLKPVNAFFRDRSEKSYHQSLPRIKDNKLKPYRGSTSTLSSRGDLSTSLRSLQRGLGSSTESNLYDHREIILDSYLLQKEHQHLIPIPTFDPDTTESEATDNEGFVPEPPSPPRDRRPPETDTGPNRRIIVQDKFVPEDDPGHGLISRHPSTIRSEGTFITVEQEHFQFTGSDSEVPEQIPGEEPIRTIYQPDQAVSPPQANSLPPGIDEPIPIPNRGRTVGRKTCFCIILGLSVMFVLVAGISGIAAFFLVSGDTVQEPSITIHDCPDPDIIVKHLREGQTVRLVTWTLPYAIDDITGQRVEIISPQVMPGITYFPAGMRDICYRFYSYRDSMQYQQECCFIVYVLEHDEGHGSSVSSYNAVDSLLSEDSYAIDTFTTDST